MKLLPRFVPTVLIASVAPLWADPTSAPGPESVWVHFDHSGRLVYGTTPRGDRIMDFSSAGYQGGGVAIPDVVSVETLEPSGKDDAAAIQAALDRAGARPVGSDGFRGAVRLAPGVFHCAEPIRLTASGVILRGSGNREIGTTLEMTGSGHVAVQVQGRGSPEPMGESLKIVDDYVPAGTDRLTVADAAGLRVGESILVRRPTTPQWVKFMGMADLIRNGKPEHWISGPVRWERTVRAISGRTLQLDVPLSDSLDAAQLAPEGATVVAYRFPGRIDHAGVEHLRILAPVQHTVLTGRLFTGIRFAAVQDAWMRDVEFDDTMDTVGVGNGSRRITIDQVAIRHQASILGAALPADFGVDGSQVLIEDCTASGERLFYFGTGAAAAGPNVVLNCAFEGTGSIQPHQRWATGLLIDGCRVPHGEIDLMNRGEMGSGHGWAIGWAVAWNCTAKAFLIQQPPGTCNWAIGCIGDQRRAPMPIFDKATKGSRADLPQGVIDSPGVPVPPQSLYLAQLAERGR